MLLERKRCCRKVFPKSGITFKKIEGDLWQNSSVEPSLTRLMKSRIIRDFSLGSTFFIFIGSNSTQISWIKSLHAQSNSNREEMGPLCTKLLLGNKTQIVTRQKKLGLLLSTIAGHKTSLIVSLPYIYFLQR